jgi:hypothetical protein
MLLTFSAMELSFGFLDRGGDMPGFPKEANWERAIGVQIFRPTSNQRKLRPVPQHCQTALIDALKKSIHAITVLSGVKNLHE